MPQIHQCMSGKHWIFYGDPSVRQIFEYITEYMKIDYEKPEVKNDDPLYAYDKKHDITLRFEFHDVPVHHDRWLNVSKVRQTSALLDSISADTDAVVLLGLGPHFAHLPLTYFEKLINAAIDGAERLYLRNPMSRVIFKSPNTRYHEDWLRCVLGSDWIARRQTEILKEMLASHPNVGFMDVWQTTVAQLEKDRIHPLGTHTENVFKMLLTMVC